jgi:hypothetical protein
VDRTGARWSLESPSIHRGQGFRLLFIGDFEGIVSEGGIRWRVEHALSLRTFLGIAPRETSADRRVRRVDSDLARVRPADPAVQDLALPALAADHVTAHLPGARREGRG